MTMFRLALSITTGVAALMVASGAQAQMQTAPADAPATAPSEAAAPVADNQPNDIVVTAQKRTQTLIDVPQSVAVVTGAALERNQAFSFQDYAKLVPGLNISQSNPGEARLVLRGVNTGGVAATVSTYVDETPFGSSSGLVNAAILAGEFDTFDIARVEVLKGPQGTLYGASSLGGVVKFVTNTPQTDKIEARARGSVETVEGGDLSYMGSAMINLPLGDTLAIRGSGFYRRYGGFIDSIGTVGSDVAEDINSSRSYGGRVSALFTPSSDVSIRLSAILQNLKTNVDNVVESDPIDLNTLYGGLTQSRYYPQSTDIRYRVYNGTINVGLGFAELSSSTSYSTLKQRNKDDFTVQYGALLGLYSDATGPAVDIGFDTQTNLERWTQEVRLSSGASDVFEWLVGGYYTHEKGALIQFLQAYDQGTLTPSPALPLLADIFLNSRYEEYAGFANGTLHMGEKFDLTFGGRYSHNDQRASQGGTGLLAPDALGASSDENVFTWSVAPKFKFAESGAIYARVAKGFRPGGPNIIPPSAPAGTPNTYRSDSTINYEIGLKADTADRTFGIDMSVFHIDWDNVQLLALVNGYGINANGATAKSDGAEFTATLRPMPGFVYTLNGAYTNARLTADTDAVAVGGRKGDKLPFVPMWSVSANADYDWKIGDATAFVGGTVRVLDKQPGNYSPAYLATYGRQLMLPSYEVIDLRAGIDFGRFSIEAYAKNLANAQGKTSANYTAPASYPNGAVGTGIIRPRTFGVTLGAGF